MAQVYYTNDGPRCVECNRKEARYNKDKNGQKRYYRDGLCQQCSAEAKHGPLDSNEGTQCVRGCTNNSGKPNKIHLNNRKLDPLSRCAGCVYDDNARAKGIICLVEGCDEPGAKRGGYCRKHQRQGLARGRCKGCGEVKPFGDFKNQLCHNCFHSTKEQRAKKVERHRDRYANDPEFKAACIARGLLHRAIAACKDGSYTKTSKTEKQLGYTFQGFHDHIQAQLTVLDCGWSWDNHGDVWHIDHIRPLSWFAEEGRLEDANALSNLQPMCAKENLRKNNRWEGPAQ